MLFMYVWGYFSFISRLFMHFAKFWRMSAWEYVGVCVGM